MKSSIEEINPVKKKLIVEIEADEVDRKIEKAYRELGKTVRLPGFRPGKIPFRILEGRFGKEVLSDVTRDLVNESLPKALEETDAFPLSMPSIENGIPEKGKAFQYTAVMEVRPQFELKDYMGLEIQKEKLSVTDENVERQIQEIRRARGQLQTVEEERPVQDGDYVTLRFEGLEDGKPIEGLKADDHMLRIGSGDFHPEFEKRLIGCGKGESVTIRVDFEADYRDKNLAGKSVDFNVDLLELKEMDLPELNDDFVKGLGGSMETVEDLGDEVRREVTKREEKRIDRDLKNRLIQRICDTVDFVLPESMVEQELGNAVESIRRNVARSGGDLDKAGLDEVKLREDLRPASEFRVKRMLVLGEIAKQNDVEVTEEDVAQGFVELAGGIGQDPKVIRRYYEANKLMEAFRDNLFEEKTLSFLVDGAKVEEVEGDKISKENTL